MRREPLRTLVESHIREANGNVQSGLTAFNEQMTRFVSSGRLSLENVRLGDLFESMVARNYDVDLTNAVGICEAMNAAGMPTLTGTLLHPVFMREFQPLVDAPLKLVQQVESKRKEETIGGLTAHDALEEVGEAEPYEESQPEEKTAKVKNHKFGRVISLTKEMVLFDQTGEVLRKARRIGIRGGTHLHAFIIQKVCDIAVTATGEAAGTAYKPDGVAHAVYQASHVALDGFANDNLEASALSYDGLTTVKQKFGLMKDEKGEPILMFPRFLVVPTALGIKARQLMTSNVSFDEGGTLFTGLGNNVHRGAYEIVESPILDAVTSQAWWLGDPSLQNVLQWVWRPTTESLGGNTQLAFNNDIVSQHKISYMGGIGATDYRHVIQGNAL